MTDTLTDTYLDWIRAGLKQPGKTQLGLARHIGIAHPQITMLLKGKRRLKVDEIPRIAEYLETEPPSSVGIEVTAGSSTTARLRQVLVRLENAPESLQERIISFAEFELGNYAKSREKETKPAS